MRTATKIRNFTGVAALYLLSEPVEYEGLGDGRKTTSYVVVSAVEVIFTGPETYIFPADADGNVLSWGELHGSYRGGLSHEAALLGAGFEVIP